MVFEAQKKKFDAFLTLYLDGALAKYDFTILGGHVSCFGPGWFRRWSEG